MKTIGFVFSSALLLLGCAHAPNLAGEHLILANEDIKSWRLYSYKNYPNNEGSVRQYAPPETDSRKSWPFKKNRKSWSVLVSIAWLNDSTIPVKQFVASQNRVKNNKCPGTKLQVLEADEYNEYYIFDIPACTAVDGKSVSEINRVIRGNEAIFLITYGVHDRELTASEKEEWLSILRKSYIAKGEHNEKVR